MTDADYTNDLALLANTPAQAKSLLHSLGQAAESISLYMKVSQTEYMCFQQKGAISTFRGRPLKLVDQFSCLISNISSTESDISICLTKAWNAIDSIYIYVYIYTIEIETKSF